MALLLRLPTYKDRDQVGEKHLRGRQGRHSGALRHSAAQVGAHVYQADQDRFKY